MDFGEAFYTKSPSIQPFQTDIDGLIAKIMNPLAACKWITRKQLK
jgi:hypothetical protein